MNKEKVFEAVAEHFNAHNVMTDNDFNDICDDFSREEIKNG